MNHDRVSVLRARARIAIAAICATLTVLGGVPCRTLGADPPAPLLRSVQALLDSQGQEWLASRDAFLQLPEAEHAAALEYLSRADATKEEKTLALILRTHIERPADVAAYEAGLAKDITHPMIGRSGDPVYGSSWPIPNSDNYGYIVEHIWKRSDLSRELRKYPFGALVNRVRESDSLLVLLDLYPDRSSTIAMALSGVPDAGDDPRVSVAMLTAYQRARTEHPPKSAAARIVMLYTASMGTPRARDAVLKMHAIERNLMIQQGKAPWNDQGEAKAAYAAASKEYRQGTQKQFVDESRREAALDILKEQQAEAFERLIEVHLWQAYADAYQRLRDAGVPVNPPPEP